MHVQPVGYGKKCVTTKTHQREKIATEAVAIFICELY